MTPKPTLQHAPNPWFTTHDDVLYVGGRPLPDIATQVGRTPFYVYDSAIMTQKVELLRRTLPAEIQLHYAMKANPMPAVVKHLATQVDGIDVASAAEMEVALATSMAPTHISFAGPGKTIDELHRAAAAGIIINVESEREIAVLTAYSAGTQRRPNIAIRINPDFELKTSGMKMAGGPKPFGIDAERVPSVLRDLHHAPLNFCGFHIFSGSQNLRAEALIEAQQKTIELALRLAADTPAPIRCLNIGGGFGIPYFPGEPLLELAPIAENLRALLTTVRTRLPNTNVVLELGRYLVGEAGLYVCRIVDKKISRGHTFLITDGGLHHHLAASGNFGQVLRKNYPVVIGTRMHSTTLETVSIVGPLCTPLDLIADRVTLPRAEIGDLVVVMQSGAYGLTASPTRFLSHPEPSEILL